VTPLTSQLASALSRAANGWTLLTHAGATPRPHALCALVRAARGAAREGDAAAPVPAAFSPAARLWAGGGGWRQGEPASASSSAALAASASSSAAASASALYLPLGSALGVGALRASLGRSTFVRSATLREHLRKGTLPMGDVELGLGLGLGDEWGEPSACRHMTWQLLARLAAAGGAVEPVPLALFDLHHQLAESPPGAACPGGGGACAGVQPRGPGFVPSVVLAGSRTLAVRGRNASASSWSPDVLDLSAVMLVLQGLVESSASRAARF